MANTYIVHSFNSGTLPSSWGLSNEPWSKAVICYKFNSCWNIRTCHERETVVGTEPAVHVEINCIRAQKGVPLPKERRKMDADSDDNCSVRAYAAVVTQVTQSDGDVAKAASVGEADQQWLTCDANS